MRHLTGFAALVFVAALPALGQESYPGAEYVSGQAGFDKKLKGTLFVTDSEVRFTTDKGQPIFSVPMATVTDAKATREHEGGSFGRKVALGAFASKNIEYLEIDTKTDSGANAIVFKTAKKQSAAMAEKIKFYAEKARAAKKK